MAKIHTLKIKNFRGFESFEHVFGFSNFICLIGRGDSGKTTILEAISRVLSPSWNLSFYDTDFYNCDISNPIEIEVTLYEVPKRLLLEDTFGTYKRFLDPQSGIIQDNAKDDSLSALTIRLIVEKDLEPRWEVVNARQTPVKIGSGDRARLNVFLIADSIDRHFSWNKGTPLFSLLKQEDTENPNVNVILDSLRDAKSKIDENEFEHLSIVLDRVKNSASALGLDISAANTTIDSKDISIMDGRISLHEEKIPLRLKGKSSKRLVSIAIQTELAKDGGIILIDEIEQGLEQVRSRHLAKTLKNNNSSQIFVTTHSQSVLVELTSSDLFLLKEPSEKLIVFPSSLQGCLRGNPEAFFSKRILVCEGPTELGVIRALNDFRIKNGKENMALKGVSAINGKGSELVAYCKAFASIGYEVRLFCDSDDEGVNTQKKSMRTAGIRIFDWEDQYCLEEAIFSNIEVSLVEKALKLYAKIKLEDDNSKTLDAVKESIKASISSKIADVNWPLTSDTCDLQTKKEIGKIAKNKSWFKSETKGQEFGDLVFQNYTSLKPCNPIKLNFDGISDWIDNG